MKKLSALITITVGLMALPATNALAAWTELGSNDAMSVLVDTATLRKDGDKAQILSMLDLKKPGVNPTSKQVVNSLIGLNEYNCSNATYRPIEFKEFAGAKGSGKVVTDNKSPDAPFEPVVSGSWTAGVFNIACKAK